jgi:hypothetical protein
MQESAFPYDNRIYIYFHYNFVIEDELLKLDLDDNEVIYLTSLYLLMSKDIMCNQCFFLTLTYFNAFLTYSMFMF